MKALPLALCVALTGATALGIWSYTRTDHAPAVAHGRPFATTASGEEFQQLEARANEPLSRTCRLVIYTTRRGELIDAIALQNQQDSGDYLIHVRYDQESLRSGDSQLRAVRLPTSTSQNLGGLLEQTLAPQLFAPEPRDRQMLADLGGYWIFLRRPDKSTVTYVIPRYRLHQNPQSRAFQQLLQRLEAVLQNQTKDDSNALAELDRLVMPAAR